MERGSVSPWKSSRQNQLARGPQRQEGAGVLILQLPSSRAPPGRDPLGGTSLALGLRRSPRVKTQGARRAPHARDVGFWVSGEWGQPHRLLPLWESVTQMLLSRFENKLSRQQVTWGGKTRVYSGWQTIENLKDKQVRGGKLICEVCDGKKSSQEPQTS